VGIPTVSITLYRQIATKLKLPRALYLRFPFGFPLGRTQEQQHQIIQDALKAFTGITEPGTVIDLPYVWEG